MSVITVSNTGGNWNATGTWVGGVLPLTTDTIAYTSTSGSLTVNVASICAGMDMTNYSAGKTITFTSTLTINGNWNLGSGAYTQAGASGVIMPVSATITSNGVTWSRTLTFQGTSQTYTLAGNDLTVSGLLTLSPVTTMVWSGAFNINVLGGLTVSGTAGATISGASTPIIIKGGTWNHTAASYIQNAITINPTSPGLTITNTYVNCPLLSYTASGGGTYSMNGTFTINKTNTIDCGGLYFNNLTLSPTATGTYSLPSNINTTGTLQLTSAGSQPFGFSGVGLLNFSNAGASIVGSLSINMGSQITFPSSDINILNLTLQSITTGSGVIGPPNTNVNGNLTAVGTLQFAWSGNINMVGTGTITTPSAPAQQYYLFINTTGTITFPSSSVFTVKVYPTGFRQCKFQYIAGTVVVQPGHTFYCILGTTNYQIDSGPIVWSNFTIASTTYGITIPTNGTVIISGTFSTLAGVSTAAAHVPIIGATNSKLTLQASATQNLEYVNGTNIDSSGGRTIWTWGGTMSNTKNWMTIPTQPGNISNTF